jgi:hypothetical protein
MIYLPVSISHGIQIYSVIAPTFEIQLTTANYKHTMSQSDKVRTLLNSINRQSMPQPELRGSYRYGGGPINGSS